jgi:hypothetical protein
MCVSNAGELFASFSISGVNQALYTIDPLTGEYELVHTFSAEDIGDGNSIMALESCDGDLVALLTYGRIYRINTETYELTELGTLPDYIWSSLAAVPEPGVVVMVVGGIAALVMRRRRG